MGHVVKIMLRAIGLVLAWSTLLAVASYTSPSGGVGSFGYPAWAGGRALPLRWWFRGFGLVVSKRRGCWRFRPGGTSDVDTPLGWFTDGVLRGRCPACARSLPSGLGPQTALRALVSGGPSFPTIEHVPWR